MIFNANLAVVECECGATLFRILFYQELMGVYRFGESRLKMGLQNKVEFGGVYSVQSPSGFGAEVCECYGETGKKIFFARSEKSFCCQISFGKLMDIGDSSILQR